MTTGYITKWALTRGILKIEGMHIVDGMYLSKNPGQSGRVFVKLGIDGFLTEEEAIQNANHKRDLKIGSHNRAIKKLRELKF
jgi:hypothetical protein